MSESSGLRAAALHIELHDRYRIASETLTMFAAVLALQERLDDDRRLLSPHVQDKLDTWQQEESRAFDVLHRERTRMRAALGYEEGAPCSLILSGRPFGITESTVVVLERAAENGVNCLPRERVGGE